MGFRLFRRKFVVRRFGEEVISGGYGSVSYTDSIEELNVQPLSGDELQALPEGERRTKRMKAFGDFLFTAADQDSGRRGDWIFYQGKMDPAGHWYQCVSAIGWDHTLLCHCRSELVQVAEAEAINVPPPEISLCDRKVGRDEGF